MPLYFFAIILPELLSEKITAIKLSISEIYNTNKALKLFPHITLKSPFQMANEMENEVITAFESMAKKHRPFNVRLNGFGSFEKRKPVFFIQPDVSVSLLELQKDVVDTLNNRFPFIVSSHDKKFHPHITLAYRDLFLQQFRELQDEYRNRSFLETFQVNDFHLLVHEDSQWQIASKFNLRC